MTGGGFDYLGLGAPGHLALCRRRNHLVLGRDQVPARLDAPGRLTNWTAQRLREYVSVLIARAVAVRHLTEVLAHNAALHLDLDA